MVTGGWGAASDAGGVPLEKGGVVLIGGVVAQGGLNREQKANAFPEDSLLITLVLH